MAGRTVTGQPAVAGSVDTKYDGTYAGAATRGNPYGAGGAGNPYGAAGGTAGRTTDRTPTMASRTTTRSPCPTTPITSSLPVGAMIIMVAGVSYLMSQDGSYSKKTTDSQGKAAYQSVPAPAGSAAQDSSRARALVTVSGTTYYLNSNTFYRRIVQGTQEQFVVVSPPAGVVFIQALPPDFEVVQLNTIYFEASGHYYVPYLSVDAKELYVLVDTPPQPPAPTQAAAPKPAAPTPVGPAPAPVAAPAIRTVDETLTVPTGTLVLVRLQKDVSSETAKQGDRFQAFLDQDIAANGRLIVAKGAKVYGVVTEVDQGSKMKGKALLSVALTDLQVGDQVVSIKTQPLQVQGQKSSGGKKLAGGAILGATIGAIADGGEGAAIGAAVGAGVGGAAAAAGNVDPAVIPAQKLEAFTVAVPFQVHIMTNVAVRAE